ncbi:MAG: ethylbenzene dehydrogenase-related protein [Candidatus Binatia bacterium]
MMRLRLVSGLLSSACLAVWVAGAFAQQKPPESPANLAKGKVIYMKRCSFCHGRVGKGDGPVADYLNPRPRDFTEGVYKLRTTQSGEVPLDEDLFRTITRGIPGTAMQSFEGRLSETERWQVIYFVKTFAGDLFKEPPERARIGSEKSRSAEKGKVAYRKAKCWQCHGQEGRGDGPSAAQLKDDWGFPILPADLTKGWRYKGGNSVTAIFTRFTTGMDGTPMPSFSETLSEEERWNLAAYVKSTIKKPQAGREPVLKSKRVDRDLPLDSSDPLWQEAEPLDVPLSGQVVVAPRWQNHSVDLISVRSLYNDRAVAFLLEWDDRFKDTVHQGELVSVKDTYAKPDPNKKWMLRDSVEMQFPLKISEGADSPYFFLGQPDKPVVLWRWNADRNKDGGRDRAVEELNAKGPKNAVAAQPAESQEVVGKGTWKDGRWTVVMKRPLVPKDAEKDITFEVGRIVPIAFHVWDGSNGERGLLGAISSWVYLLMEPSTSWWVYAYAVIGVLVAGVGEWWLVRQVR